MLSFSTTTNLEPVSSSVPPPFPLSLSLLPASPSLCLSSQTEIERYKTCFSQLLTGQEESMARLQWRDRDQEDSSRLRGEPWWRSEKTDTWKRLRGSWRPRARFSKGMFPPPTTSPIFFFPSSSSFSLWFWEDCYVDKAKNIVRHSARFLKDSLPLLFFFPPSLPLFLFVWRGWLSRQG